MRPVARNMGWIVVALVVAITALLFASHELFPPFNPAGGTSAAK